MAFTTMGEITDSLLIADDGRASAEYSVSVSSSSNVGRELLMLSGETMMVDDRDAVVRGSEVPSKGVGSVFGVARKQIISKNTSNHMTKRAYPQPVHLHLLHLSRDQDYHHNKRPSSHGEA